MKKFEYTLDALGNRTDVTFGGNTESYTLDNLNRVTDIDYISGDDVEYTYDDNGNILTMKVGAATTTYTINAADQITSDGTDSYTYDENGNLTDRGSDDFTWDYANRMTSATVDSTTVDYSYDGDGVRVDKTVSAATTDYLWDREQGLPKLVDDETHGFLHSGGILGQIDSANDEEYLLDDGLGSLRGLTDDLGDLTGTADYDVFGKVRASSGDSSIFGFTGEQFDSETGSTFLRSRYLDPVPGRFISADSVQPNAPGTQGYNLYAYTANNPTTWTDPSGHMSLEQLQTLTAYFLATDLLVQMANSCRLMAASNGQTIQGGYCTLVPAGFSLLLVGCALNPLCLGGAFEQMGLMDEYGSGWTTEDVWTFEDNKEAVNSWPPSVPDLTNLFSEEIPVPTFESPEELLEEIRNRNGSPPYGYKGGKTFEDEQGALEELGGSGDYKEYDVEPNIEGVDRGPGRILIDQQTGQAWYTAEHYEPGSFVPME